MADRKAYNHWHWDRFLERIGMDYEDVKIVADVTSMKHFMVWRGRGGVVFRHYFEDVPNNCDTDELNAIKVKVKLSKC